MKEKEVAEKFKKWLEKQSWESKLEFHTEYELLYALEINEYNGKEDRYFQKRPFKTDILISVPVHAKKAWFPAVVIEVKYKSLITHDPIIYGVKAEHHRAIHPYLRYGMLVVGVDSLPGRLIRHGKKFDFLIAIKNPIPERNKQSVIHKILRNEIKTAITMRDALKDNRSRHRKKFWYLHKSIEFNQK